MRVPGTRYWTGIFHASMVSRVPSDRRLFGMCCELHLFSSFPVISCRAGQRHFIYSHTHTHNKKLHPTCQCFCKLGDLHLIVPCFGLLIRIHYNRYLPHHVVSYGPSTRKPSSLCTTPSLENAAHLQRASKWCVEATCNRVESHHVHVRKESAMVAAPAPSRTPIVSEKVGQEFIAVTS